VFIVAEALPKRSFLNTREVDNAADTPGNICKTALSLHGFMTFDTSTRQMSRCVHASKMNWHDTLGWGPDGDMVVVSTHLHIRIDGDMDFEDPETPDFRIAKIPGVGQSFTAE